MPIRLLARKLDNTDLAVSDEIDTELFYLSYYNGFSGSAQFGPYTTELKPVPGSNFPYGVEVEPDRI